MSLQQFFWRRLPVYPGSWGYFTPKHISISRAHSNKIPPAIPVFSGSNFLMVPLPALRDVNIRQKSKMAVAKNVYTFYGYIWLMKEFLILSQQKI